MKRHPLRNRFSFFNSWIKSLKTKNIQRIFAISLTLTVLMMFLAGAVLYSKFSRTAEQNAALTTQQIIQQVNFNLENYFSEIANLFDLADEKISGSPTILSTELAKDLRTITATRHDIVSLGIFSAAGDLVAGVPYADLRANTHLIEQSWFDLAMKHPGQLTVSAPHIQNLFKGQYPWVVSMSKGVEFTQGGQTVKGILLIDVNFRIIDELCRRVSLGKRGYVYLLDPVGNLIYHPQQQLIYLNLKRENVERALNYSYGSFKDELDGEPRLISVQWVTDVGWKIVGVSYMDEIKTSRKGLSLFIVWVLAFFAGFILLVSFYLSAEITKPIRRLEKTMRRVEKGDFSTSMEIRGAFEVEQLSIRFNAMIARIRELMEQIIHEQEAKRKSELEVLQAQINPHFLYNTLNSVVRMVGSGKNDEVITTITSLSKLFRISLSRGKNVISVREELEHVRNYLIIQQMRFKDKFRFEIDVMDEALSYQTLKLILQPIVENSLHHGVEQMADEGLIRITARVEGEALLLLIEDNGVGISPKRLENILNGEASSEDGSGVGLRNVSERIRLYYGQPYGLQIESELEEGTRVSIRIPLVKEELE
ncbi:MAG: sensor histidine kinase [Gorillibacterium sp.]|nr:sensor histidine kinase [Gorillibacterium sp.]